MNIIKLIKVNKCIYRESTTPFSWYSGIRLLTFKMMYKLYRKPKVIICQTNRMKSELLINVPILSALNVQVIPNPVDYFNLKFKLDSISIKNEEFKFNQNEIVSIGRLVPEKGYEILLKAFNHLLNAKPNFILRIIGSGPENYRLQELAKQMNIQDRVIFHGHSNNPFPYMKNATLCVVSSVMEGFPNVLLEKMCISRRVVSTLCADGVDKIPGIYKCQVNDVNSLVRSIIDALDSPYTIYSQNIRKMRKHVKSRSVGSYVDKVIESTSE